MFPCVSLVTKPTPERPPIATTPCVRVSIRDRVRSCSFATQTAPFDATIPLGSRPTAMLSTTLFVFGSMRTIEFGLGDQGRPSPAVHLERLGLTAGVVEGVHQASDQPLTQRMRCDERVQLSDDGVCIAGRELLVDSPFEPTEAKLLEAARLLGE